MGETEVLVGYKLYVVEEWMVKSAQLWSVVEFTGNQHDKVLATAVSSRPSPASSIRLSAGKYLTPHFSSLICFIYICINIFVQKRYRHRPRGEER